MHSGNDHIHMVRNSSLYAEPNNINTISIKKKNIVNIDIAPHNKNATNLK